MILALVIVNASGLKQGSELKRGSDRRRTGGLCVMASCNLLFWSLKVKATFEPLYELGFLLLFAFVLPVQCSF